MHDLPIIVDLDVFLSAKSSFWSNFTILPWEKDFGSMPLFLVAQKNLQILTKFVMHDLPIMVDLDCFFFELKQHFEVIVAF